MKCFKNFSQILTLEKASQKDGRLLTPDDLSVLNKASIVFDEDKIHWVGLANELPKQFHHIPSHDCEGYVLTPEIVDSHTHLVFGGDRSFEYSMRLNGADYQEIANAGGGILSTMENTITTDEEELFQTGIERIERIASYGVGSIEIKSGYGLTVESERKISHVIDRLKKHFSGKIQIFNTYLAAHAVPKTYDNSHEYMQKVVYPLLEELAEQNIIDFIDIFHEEGYFNYQDSEELFKVATKLGIKIKIHADEFNDNKGALLASRYNAVSADHLLCTGEDGIDALANSQTVATLFPGTAYFLGKPLAEAQKFLKAGCKVALASDYNPGSCHCDNILLIASLCAKNFNLNMAQLWSALCLNSAHALGLYDQGALIAGNKPRFSFFKCSSIDQITYSWGRNFAISENQLIQETHQT